MSSTPWAINSEIYPLHVIGTANSLSAATNWLVNAFVAEAFKVVTGLSVEAEVAVYVSLAIFALACFIFVYCLVPETAGRPIEENVAKIVGYQSTAAQRDQGHSAGNRHDGSLATSIQAKGDSA